MRYRSVALALGLYGALGLCDAGPAPAPSRPPRPALQFLRAPPGGTWAQVLQGDRVFHGERAGGRCSACHGWDAKGTPTGNDLTTGLWIWGDGSLRMIKATILHNMAVAPGMDGALAPADVDAVAAYVWALGHQTR
ncbi:MAG: c-type cytochrome [Burkholderiales bacterium]|nr:c-type cytochrome [Burkholderiales bacterium]MDE2276571.1 c-type cytochrome [Burkholderiales bacterium]